MMRKALLVAADSSLCRSLSRRLEDEGMWVTEEITGEAALAAIQVEPPDVVIVDRKLPDMTGFELCERLRQLTEAPTLLIGVNEDPEERRFDCCEDAVSDYVPEPITQPEIVIRTLELLENVWARCHEHENPQRGRRLSIGDLTLDLNTSKVTVGDEQIHLSPTEVRLLRILVERSPRTISPEALARDLWPNGKRDLAALGNAIIGLRQAIEEDPRNPTRVTHVPEYGYRLISPEGEEDTDADAEPLGRWE